jgi:hypothetical protein
VNEIETLRRTLRQLRDQHDSRREGRRREGPA